MGFQFPAAPVNGDLHTEFGVDYVWDAASGTWNLQSGGAMTDYVLKTGDQMSGPLRVNSSAANSGLYVGMPDGTTTKLSLTPSSGSHSGLIEFWADNGTTRRGYIGYGDATYLNINAENGAKWSISGGLYSTGGGISWGTNTAKTDPFDFSAGICLYGIGTTSQFGFSITSGTLNYCVQTQANRHVFRVGTTNPLIIEDQGITLAGSIAGATTINASSYIDAGGGVYSTAGHFIARSGSYYKYEPSNQDAWTTMIGGTDAKLDYNGTGAEGQIRHFTLNGGYSDNWAFQNSIASPPGCDSNGSASMRGALIKSREVLKKDIRRDCAADMVGAFDALKPVAFRWNDDSLWPPRDESGQPKKNPYPRDEREKFGFVVEDMMKHPMLEHTVQEINHGKKDFAYDMAQVLALAVAKIKQLEAEIVTLKKAK